MVAPEHSDNEPDYMSKIGAPGYLIISKLFQNCERVVRMQSPHGHPSCNTVADCRNRQDCLKGACECMINFGYTGFPACDQRTKVGWPALLIQPPILCIYYILYILYILYRPLSPTYLSRAAADYHLVTRLAVVSACGPISGLCAGAGRVCPLHRLSTHCHTLGAHKTGRHLPHPFLKRNGLCRAHGWRRGIPNGIAYMAYTGPQAKRASAGHAFPLGPE
jgi:hypothetical protein